VTVAVVPNVWLRPHNQRREADAAKALLTVPDGDHLTLINVYNNYMLSTSSFCSSFLTDMTCTTDLHDKNWAWNQYLSARSLIQADNVRAQLQRTMEKYEVEIVTIAEPKKLYLAVRQALVCGFFMQVAHKEGEKGSYLTVKDNQVILVIIFLYDVC
jgi:pre-mRNA-splicing factor ATP-dependent RNA helicase DHX15/PRP43